MDTLLVHGKIFYLLIFLDSKLVLDSELLILATLDLSSLIFLSPQIQWQFQSSGQDFLSFSSMITEIVYIRQPQHFWEPKTLWLCWEPIRSSSDKFSNQSSQSESASVVFVKIITNIFSVPRLKIQWKLKKFDVFSFSAFREGEAQI